jgi:nitric oxide reductase subunit B
VPWLNRFTHGTFVTVAHAMGTTIGINSMILLAGIAYHGRLEISNGFNKWLNVLQLSLLFFLISLFVIGLYTGLNRESMADAVLRSQLRPYVKATMLLGMCTALCFIPVLKMLYCRLSRPADAAAA